MALFTGGYMVVGMTDGLEPASCFRYNSRYRGAR